MIKYYKKCPSRKTIGKNTRGGKKLFRDEKGWYFK
jgi:hypothetical protein